MVLFWLPPPSPLSVAPFVIDGSVGALDPRESSLQQRVLLLCEAWSERFSVPAARRCSPRPLCDSLSCVRLRNEGFFAASCHGVVLWFFRHCWAHRSSCLFLSFWLRLKIFVYLVIVTRYFPSRVFMTFSLSGHRHMLRNVLRTAARCDCASCSLTCIARGWPFPRFGFVRARLSAE